MYANHHFLLNNYFHWKEMSRKWISITFLIRSYSSSGIYIYHTSSSYSSSIPFWVLILFLSYCNYTIPSLYTHSVCAYTFIFHSWIKCIFPGRIFDTSFYHVKLIRKVYQYCKEIESLLISCWPVCCIHRFILNLCVIEIKCGNLYMLSVLFSLICLWANKICKIN